MKCLEPQKNFIWIGGNAYVYGVWLEKLLDETTSAHGLVNIPISSCAGVNINALTTRHPMYQVFSQRQWRE